MTHAPPSTAQAEAGALSPLLSELERVLGEEAEALRKLDRNGIDRVVEQKLRLCQDIAAAGLQASGQHKITLERIKKLAIKNQMLLAHARDSVRQVLGLASGQTAAAPALGGLRLDVRV